MSLFRTLQNSPATISIFHNNKVPLSVKLYDILKSAETKSDEKFHIDLEADKLPTFDQYQSIYSNCIRTETCKKVLNHCYPFLHDQLHHKHPTNKITTKGVEPTKVFTPDEYKVISDAFNDSVNHVEDGTLREDPAHIFRAPLVVDWDQNLIAGDENSLKEILKKYE